MWDHLFWHYLLSHLLVLWYDQFLQLVLWDQPGIKIYSWIVSASLIYRMSISISWDHFSKIKTETVKWNYIFPILLRLLIGIKHPNCWKQLVIKACQYSLINACYSQLFEMWFSSVMLIQFSYTTSGDFFSEFLKLNLIISVCITCNRK